MNYIKKIIFQIIILLLFINDIAYASQSEYSLGTAIIKLIIYTLIIIAVLISTIYGTRFIAKNSKKFIRSKYMRIVDALSFGANIKILMIEINDFIYIIAINNNSIKLIDKLPKDEILIKGNFEERLSKYNINNKHINNISTNIKKIIDASNKLNDKEEKENED